MERCGSARIRVQGGQWTRPTPRPPAGSLALLRGTAGAAGVNRGVDRSAERRRIQRVDLHRECARAASSELEVPMTVPFAVRPPPGRARWRRRTRSDARRAPARRRRCRALAAASGLVACPDGSSECPIARRRRAVRECHRGRAGGRDTKYSVSTAIQVLL